MHDEASPHFAVVIREWLNAQFSGKWMGRLGLHEWLARSPDLISHYDAFLWDWLKEQVYSTKPRNLEELKGM